MSIFFNIPIISWIQQVYIYFLAVPIVLLFYSIYYKQYKKYRVDIFIMFAIAFVQSIVNTFLSLFYAFGYGNKYVLLVGIAIAFVIECVGYYIASHNPTPDKSQEFAFFHKRQYAYALQWFCNLMYFFMISGFISHLIFKRLSPFSIPLILFIYAYVKKRIHDYKSDLFFTTISASILSLLIWYFYFIIFRTQNIQEEANIMVIMSGVSLFGLFTIYEIAENLGVRSNINKKFAIYPLLLLFQWLILLLLVFG